MPEEMRYGLKNKKYFSTGRIPAGFGRSAPDHKEAGDRPRSFYFMTAINYFFTDQYDKGKSYIDKLSYSAHIDSLAVAAILKDLEKNSKKIPTPPDG